MLLYYYMYTVAIKYDRIFILLPPPRHRRWRRESTAAAAAAAAASDRRFTISFIRTLYMLYIRQKMYIIKLFNVCTTYYYYKCFVSVFRRSRFPPNATLWAITCVCAHTHTHTHIYVLYGGYQLRLHIFYWSLYRPQSSFSFFCFSAQTVPCSQS